MASIASVAPTTPATDTAARSALRRHMARPMPAATNPSTSRTTHSFGSPATANDVSPSAYGRGSANSALTTRSSRWATTNAAVAATASVRLPVTISHESRSPNRTLTPMGPKRPLKPAIARPSASTRVGWGCGNSATVAALVRTKLRTGRAATSGSARPTSLTWVTMRRDGQAGLNSWIDPARSAIATPSAVATNKRATDRVLQLAAVHLCTGSSSDRPDARPLQWRTRRPPGRCDRPATTVRSR